jgi:hypothetical protein
VVDRATRLGILEEGYHQHRHSPHDLTVTALENGLTRHLDLACAIVWTECRLTSEVNELPPKVSLVLWSILRSQTDTVSQPFVNLQRSQDGSLTCSKLLGRRGSSQVVVLVLWSTKYTLAVLVNLISHPEGSGPSWLTVCGWTFKLPP